MTIRDNKTLASAPAETYDADAVAVNVDGDDISFAHAAMSVELGASGYGNNNTTRNNTAANANTPSIAYSTGKPLKPPSPKHTVQQPQSSSTTIAVATGAPTSITQTTSSTYSTSIVWKQFCICGIFILSLLIILFIML
jgi:hypothetical protein